VSDRATAKNRLSGRRLVIASHNPGKVGEIAELLRPLGIAVVGAGELGLAEPEETQDTFAGNARLKAMAAAEAARLPALADDSGLVVDALGGRPGIRSARWAGADKDFDQAMARVLKELGQSADRNARFVCALALAWPEGDCDVFEGVIEGTIAQMKRGHNGFGYDPIFLPLNSTMTFGEMEPQAKHRISHRAAAFKKLIEACFGQAGAPA
jgi:XTP/dITP diphosphohydrolase